VANITASRVSGERLRKLRVFQPHEYYSLDYAEQQVAALKLTPPKTAGALPEIVAESLQIEKREPLLAEIESFITAVQTRTAPVVSGAEGRRALALAIEVLEKIKAHSERAGIGLTFE
jgi:predicted dehydrogenase